MEDVIWLEYEPGSHHGTLEFYSYSVEDGSYR